MKSSLCDDFTISFMIKLKDCLNCDYKLIEKDGDFLIKLSKKNKIYFYLADSEGTLKVQVKSGDLVDSEFVYVTIVKNLELQKVIIYINGKVDSVGCLDNVSASTTCVGELAYYFGDCSSDYELKALKMYDNAMSSEEIKTDYVWNLHNKKELFENIFTRNYANFSFNDNLYYYIMTPDGVIFFNDVSKNGNKLPEYAFTSYNVEQNEKNLTPDGLKIVKYEDLDKLFDVEMFVTNVVSWQFLPSSNDFQVAHPKSLVTGLSTVNYGYWSNGLTTPSGSNGFTPFTPYFGNQPTTAPIFPVPSNQGNLKNGFIISFVKLLLDQYIKTQNVIYRNSLGALADYLIALPGSGSSAPATFFGIPNEYPQASPNDQVVSIHNSNYLNYLKVVDVLLTNLYIRNIIDDTRIAQLTSKYQSVLDLLFGLQFQLPSSNAIWAEFYDRDSLTGSVPVATTDGVAVAPFLSVPESVEILIYLMNLENPTVAQKKVIKSAMEWLNVHSINKLFTNYVQYFDANTNTMVLAQNKYTTTPSQLILHPHYYDVTLGNPIDKAGVTIDATYLNITFNTLSLSQQEGVFGTWVNDANDMYNQWVKIYDSSCVVSPVPPIPNQCGCKCKKSCKSC
jgi:PelA/Pel-15E family pectate lyase